MEPSSPENFSPELFEQRVNHYQTRAESLLDKYGNDFDRFTKGYENLVSVGDERLSGIETTGYNILQNASDMHLASEKPLIFYGNYIGRTRHFGLLLATMEKEGIITPEQVEFSPRGTKVLYDLSWGDVSPDLAQIMIIQRKESQGESEHGVLQSVETVLTFSPQSDKQALRITSFLKERANQYKANAIEGSNFDPDIRATSILRNVLPQDEFPAVIANIHSSNNGQTVVLRKETIFSKQWKAVPIEANEELVGYLASADVLA